MGEGREGDWECSGCKNRNYAFRSFCNRCKQPRLLVDNKTPPDSKWLPRIGDWICTGCTNNNYASREKCKKCGQPKEVAAMPAIAMPGASLPTYSHYFARAPAALEQKLHLGIIGNGAPQQSFPFRSNWPVRDEYGFPPAFSWPAGGSETSGLQFSSPLNQQFSVPKGWRNGDWICNCGFHNYSSRSQCKNCNASVPPALGTKRLASEELVHDFDNKRLNSGHANGEMLPFPGFGHLRGTKGESETRNFPQCSSMSAILTPNWQASMHIHHATIPAILGKGANQWRSGDWMCTKCNNHNYASRAQCNRCKTQRDTATQLLNAA